MKWDGIEWNRIKCNGIVWYGMDLFKVSFLLARRLGQVRGANHLSESGSAEVKIAYVTFVILKSHDFLL